MIDRFRGVKCITTDKAAIPQELRDKSCWFACQGERNGTYTRMKELRWAIARLVIAFAGEQKGLIQAAVRH